MNEDAAAPQTWHAGERALQGSVGMAARMAELGARVIRTSLSEQHRAFYPLLPFIVLGAVDRSGWPWATIRAGRAGFLGAPDQEHLELTTCLEDEDPAEAGLGVARKVGLLGIDLDTKRRNRLNGVVVERDGRHIAVKVEQSFGNCPQYIERRAFAFHRDPGEPALARARRLDRLDDHSRDLIRQTDGFFVASYAVREDDTVQVDASHRGGSPGFVTIDAADVLTVPDYPGNRHFATLGNLLLTRRAGAVFVDFATGDLLQVTGDAEVLLAGAEIDRMAGAERAWRLRLRQIVYRPAALPLHWTKVAATP